MDQVLVNDSTQLLRRGDFDLAVEDLCVIALEHNRPRRGFVAVERVTGDARDGFVINDGLAVEPDGDFAANQGDILSRTGQSMDEKRRGRTRDRLIRRTRIAAWPTTAKATANAHWMITTKRCNSTRATRTPILIAVCC